MTKAVCSPEMSANFYQNIQLHIWSDSTLHNHQYETLKSNLSCLGLFQECVLSSLMEILTTHIGLRKRKYYSKLLEVNSNYLKYSTVITKWSLWKYTIYDKINDLNYGLIHKSTKSIRYVTMYDRHPVICNSIITNTHCHYLKLRWTVALLKTITWQYTDFPHISTCCCCKATE